jgi:hypothetical protein
VLSSPKLILQTVYLSLAVISFKAEIILNKGFPIQIIKFFSFRLLIIIIIHEQIMKAML